MPSRMDEMERRRAKEREKKRKQREKLKQNENKYAAVKKKDAERKKEDRKSFKEQSQKHPRKFRSEIEKNKMLNQNRVDKFRAKKKSQNENRSPDLHSQKKRRNKEIKQTKISEQRESEKRKKEANRQRVKSFRLRVRLRDTTVTSTGSSVKESPTAYQHRSSETRAFQRVMGKMPKTPAKRVQIIQKMLLKTTPRSRNALRETVIQTPKKRTQTRRKLGDNYSILDSVKKNVTKLQSQKAKKSAVRIVASSLLKKSRKISAAARALGVSRKTVSRSVNSGEERKPRTDKVSAEDASLVHNLYLEEASRPMPNKRDVLLIRNENGEKKEHVPKHVMEMTQDVAYQKFKDANPEVKIKKRKFDSLRPPQVRRINTSSRIVCCCTYCENVRLKVDALNAVSGQSYQSTSDILGKTLCDKTGKYHSASCLKRTCEHCGTEKLRHEFQDVPADRQVNWKEWKKQTMPLDSERNVTRVTLADCEAPFHEFLEKVCAAVEPHAEHLFRAGWQYDQFRENIENVKDGELIMAMDFSENYTCRHGRETQSFHWNQRQITLHPIMLYYKKDGELQKEGFTVISDDLKHDAHAVAEFEKAAVTHVKEQGVDVKEIHQWTDGCAAQYKGRNSFAEISLAETKHEASVVRNYFETSHGKGPCDGLGGIVKRKVSNAVLQDTNLSVASASDLHQFCEEKLKTVGDSTYNSRRSKYAASKRSFKLVEKINRENSTAAKTLPGCRKLHSVASTGVGFQVKVRSLSCYCEGCKDGTQCSNGDYVDGWENKILKPVDAARQAAEQQPEADPVCEPRNQDDNSHVSVKVNDFVSVKFSTKKSKVCFFGKVVDTDDDEVCVEYLERKETMYQYPNDREESWQSVSDVICQLPVPETVVCGSRVKLNFALSDELREQLKDFKLR